MIRIYTLVMFLLTAATLAGGSIGFLYPAGGERGGTVEIVVGGQGLWGFSNARVSGGGVSVLSCKPVPGFPIPVSEQRRWIERYLRGIYAGTPVKPSKPEDTETWRKCAWWENLEELTLLERSLLMHSLYVPKNSLQMSPAIAQLFIVKLKIAPDAKPGIREFRLVGGKNNPRLSNPMRFDIGTMPEKLEPFFPLAPAKRPVPELPIPGVQNGQVEPGETDLFRFRARKGELISFDLKGRALNPFLGDGVPGHFQPVLEIFNSAGKSIAFADDNYFHPDPVLEFRVPEDGEYTLAVRDALLRGRSDFVYRVEMRHESVPWRIEAAPVPGIPRLTAEQAVSQGEVKIPVAISGVLSAPGEKAEFLFTAEKGEAIVAEVWARRLNSPLDSRIAIYAPSGKLAAENDDFKRPDTGTLHQHVDSLCSFEAPESGRYRIVLHDTAGAGGKDFGYELRIDHPRPGLRAWIAPSALEVGMDGAAEPFRVLVERLEGLKGEVRFELENADNIRLCGASVLPADATEGTITLRSSWTRNNQLLFPKLWAVSGKVRVPVEPADSAMQAFAYTHLIPARELIASRCWVRGGGDRFRWNEDHDFVIRLVPGGSADFSVSMLPHEQHKAQEAEFTLADPPAGVTLETLRTRQGYLLRFKASKEIKPGIFNRLVSFRYSYNRPPNKEGKVTKVSSTLQLPVFRLELLEQ